MTKKQKDSGAFSPRRRGSSRSNKNHTRGGYRCPECGWADRTLALLMKHKALMRHS